MYALCMVEVMALRGGQEGEVVARVVDGGADDDQGEPQPRHGEVRAHEQRAPHYGSQVDHIVLQRVTVDGGDANWGGPLVVRLMNVLVETRMVE